MRITMNSFFKSVDAAGANQDANFEMEGLVGYHSPGCTNCSECPFRDHWIMCLLYPCESEHPLYQTICGCTLGTIVGTLAVSKIMSNNTDANI